MPPVLPHDRRQLTQRSSIALTCLLVAFAALMGALAGLGRIDQTLYDRAISLISRPAPTDLVLVTVDDESIAALGRWPWTRRTHAALLDQLREARAVGLDLIFSEADSNDPQADAVLADAIRRHGHVVLPIVLDDLARAQTYQPPIPTLANAAAGLGFINIPLDPDGVVRETAWNRKVGGVPVPHFVLSLMATGGEAAAARAFGQRFGAEDQSLIPFAGPPGHLRTVSYLSVLQGQVPPEWFRDKYVLVGAWATGLSDAFPTPVSHRASGMAGVEILGNLLQAARQEISLRAATPWENALAAALPVLLLCLVLRHASPKTSLLLTVLLPWIILPGALLMLRYGGIWFPPAAALLGVAICYPIWSWRSQETVLRYMDTELRRLRRDYAPVLNLPRQPSLLGQRSLEDRLGQLRDALALVRNLRRFLTDGLEGMPDPTLVFDVTQRLQFRNRAAVTFFRRLSARSPHVGQQAADLLARAVPGDASRAQIRLAMDRAAESDARAGWSAEVEVRDGAARDLIVKCAPIHNTDGQFVGTILTLSDITTIRQAERHREETLRFISHDMRAPQNSILALIDMRARELDAPDETLTRIAQLSHRTLHLVDGFVQLTRAESVKMAVVPFDLAELLREVADDFWAPARAREITVTLTEPLPAADVAGDQALLRRALGNLLDNAIKYSPLGSNVTCSVAAQGTTWVVSIHDEGPGIAAADLPTVFQPFTRVGAAERADAGGAGLGLAFVRAVAERHHGSADVISMPGRGSTFLLRLPRAIQTAEPRETP